MFPRKLSRSVFTKSLTAFFFSHGALENQTKVEKVQQPELSAEKLASEKLPSAVMTPSRGQGRG